jgi:hypothetical protein
MCDVDESLKRPPASVPAGTAYGPESRDRPADAHHKVAKKIPAMIATEILSLHVPFKRHLAAHIQAVRVRKASKMNVFSKSHKPE